MNGLLITRVEPGSLARRVRRAMGPLLAGGAVVLPLAAHAQDTGAATQPAPAAQATPDSQAAPPSDGLQEIVVTAQRRSENLQRVPISITALTSDSIERANITSTTALQQVTPGLTTSVSIRSALPFIRGVGSTDSTVGSENPVALYVDGVYIDSSQAAAFSLNNIERIEVLKGPQGTLFGRNATGGLISIVTRTPSRDLGGSFEFGFGNYDTVRSSLYLTGPITSTLAADLALTYSNQDKGWGRNLLTGRDINTDRTFAARSKWLLDLDSTRITLAGDYSRQETDVGSERAIPPGAVNPGNTKFRGDFYDSQSDIYPLGVLRQAGGSLRIEHDFAAVKATSITAYRDTFFSAAIDQDETPIPVFNAFFDEIRIRTFTQEAQLASTGNAAVDWIGGLFYMHREGFQPRIRLTGLAFAGAPFFGFGTFDDGVTTSTVAPFGQVTVHVTPRTDITGGLRYTIEHQRFQGMQGNALGGVVASVDTDVTYRKLTFRAAVNHRLTDDIMAYVSFNRGFKGGAYNVNNLAAPPARPEQLDAVEAGVKADLLNRTLRINAAVYHYDYKDIQLLVAPSPSSGQISTTINAARARIIGFEGLVEAVPVSGLTISIGASYVPTAEYRSFPNAPLFVTKPGGGNNLVAFDASGERMVRAPKFTATASLSYVVRLAGGSLDFGANLYHSSRFIWNPDARYAQAAYQLLGGQIGYTVGGTGLSISAWGRNLLNKHYQAGLSETASGDAYVPGAPRTYGVKLGYRF